MSLERLRKVLDDRQADIDEEAARKQRLVLAWALVYPLVRAAVRTVNEELRSHGHELLEREPRYFGREASGYGIDYLLLPRPSGYDSLPAVVESDGTLWVGGLHSWGEGVMIVPGRATEQEVATIIAGTVRT
jgi:hypothetical protein